MNVGGFRKRSSIRNVCGDPSQHQIAEYEKALAAYTCDQRGDVPRPGLNGAPS